MCYEIVATPERVLLIMEAGGLAVACAHASGAPPENKIAAYEEANNALQESMEKELKAINLEAAGYYEWLQGEGMLAYEQIGEDLQNNIDIFAQTLLDLLG